MSQFDSDRDRNIEAQEFGVFVALHEAPFDPNDPAIFPGTQTAILNERPMHIIDHDLVNRALAKVVVIARDKRGEWANHAVCVDAGADPAVFDIEIGHLGRPPKGETRADVIRRKCAEPLSYCNSCAVTEECFAYGKENYSDIEGPHIYGGRLFGVRPIVDGKQSRKSMPINLLDNAQ